MKYKQRFKDMPIDTSWTYEEDREWFIKELSDLAFGENTIERGYSMEEVIEKLKLYCEFCSNNDASFEEFEQNG
jgi:polyphosphate kinase